MIEAPAKPVWSLLRGAYSASGLARAVHFCFVGGFTTLLYAALAWAGVSVAGLPGWVASAGACTLAGLVSYFGHRHVTFRSTRAHGQTLGRFVAAAAAGYGMAIAAPVLLGDVLGFGPFVAIAAACIGIPLVNALVLSRLVFQTPLLDRQMRRDDGSELT